MNNLRPQRHRGNTMDKLELENRISERIIRCVGSILRDCRKIGYICHPRERGDL